MYHCHKCNQVREPVLENGKPKTRSFRTGFVGTLLTCGHWARVSKDRVRA